MSSAGLSRFVYGGGLQHTQFAVQLYRLFIYATLLIELLKYCDCCRGLYAN